MTEDPKLRLRCSEPVWGWGKAFGQHGQTSFFCGAGELAQGCSWIKEPPQENGHHAGPSLLFEEILRVYSFHIPSYTSSSGQTSPILIYFLKMFVLFIYLRLPWV